MLVPGSDQALHRIDLSRTLNLYDTFSRLITRLKTKIKEARRRIAPNAVSRLNCLYVADDIEVVRSIGIDPKAPVLKVRIAKGGRVSVLLKRLAYVIDVCCQDESHTFDFSNDLNIHPQPD
jgi:hypothetical protein